MFLKNGKAGDIDGVVSEIVKNEGEKAAACLPCFPRIP